ncbi:FHA domain-containing protein [Planomonospora corallina]|uniref:FHA domain-containing protein n=1 Tax=Planomonospora corallina TaxID=1806052 RepID=A0ABV8I7C6_9ACTN
MAICPAGHDPGEAGLADGYCGVCGNRLTGTSAAPSGAAGGAAAGTGSPSPAPPGSAAEPPPGCVVCGAPVSGRFCEDCGHDRTAPPPVPAGPDGPGSPGGPPRGTAPRGSAPPGSAPPGSGPAVEWWATVEADRAHYDEVIALSGPDAARVLFPPYCPRRDVPLTGTEIRIGRASRSRALFPEIDLSGPPEDPGVSHLHAVLLPGSAGGWTLVDPGSANGTVVNGRQVETNRPVPVGDGARIHVGAWTLITLRRGRTP